MPWKELQPSGHSSESVSARLVECGLANGQIQAQEPLSSQKMTVAAMHMADMKLRAQRS
jgi:hypothetical protein